MTDSEYSEQFDRDKKDNGIYEKFKVERTDGQSAPGGKHADCQYFVLDLSCDPYAIDAVEAYAYACRDDYPSLSEDLFKYVREGRLNEPSKGDPDF